MKNENSHRLLRVLYLTDLNPADKFGSMEEQIFELARAFQKRGSSFLPVFGAKLDRQAAARYEAEGLLVESLDLIPFNWPTLRRLRQLIRLHSIELLHWNFYSPTNPYMLSLSSLAPRLRHYYADHHSRRPGSKPAAIGGWKWRAKKVLFKRYQKVLCGSDFVLDSLARQQAWKNLVRCEYFINTDRFQPDAATRLRLRRQLDVEGRFVVLAVAQLIRWKGIDVVIKALGELPESVVLWVVGEGEEAGALQSLCDEIGVASRVKFFGIQQHVEPFMQSADCFVCPSIWGEAVGLVNLEALACQLPVIASRTGGIPEFIADGENGLLFTVGDYHELARKISLLVNEPETYRRMSGQARHTAVERYAIQRRLPDYLELYRATAAG